MTLFMSKHATVEQFPVMSTANHYEFNNLFMNEYKMLEGASSRV